LLVGLVVGGWWSLVVAILNDKMLIGDSSDIWEL
jgi:hypothetical protein